MERGKENAGEREEEEANNSSNLSLLPQDPTPCSAHLLVGVPLLCLALLRVCCLRTQANSTVSFSALRKDVVNILDFMERLKNEEDQNVVDMANKIEKALKMVLAFICTYVQLSCSDLERFEDKMTFKRQEVEDMLRPILNDVDNNVGSKYNMHHVLRSFTHNMDDCISSHHHSKSSATMTEEQLNFLLMNLHHLSKHLAEQIFPLEIQFEILQNVCANIRNFHGLIVNGYVEHEIVKYVLPQLQPMAERVGRFMWNGYIDVNSLHFNLPHLLLKIIPIELEVMHIYFTNLKDSTSAEVESFINQLLETSPDILKEYLIHLQEHMVTVITPSTSGARNIHVMIEFLLIILTDLPKDFIHHDKLFDLLARVGALTTKVSTLVCDLGEESMNKESTNGTNCATLDLLENIELLKEDLEHVYLKEAEYSSQCCFPMSDGPLFMHLLLTHLKNLLDSNAYAIALIKEEIGVVKEDLEFIRSFFENIDQELCKDLWARVLDVAYEAKDVIDSIIVRDNGLLHLIFSLPIIIKNIKLIKEDVSNLLEKIPKNRSRIVNSRKKPVERKSLTSGKITVGFEEEADSIISKLTGGTKELDVISIFGMPGSGKTTLAYKVYNDKSVCRHFEIRAWCTVGQVNDKKKLWVELFNQVTGSGLKFSEVIDVADMLRIQLFGKRYLIVLDDVWDTTTWEALTSAFPIFERGSRILFTTREKKVASLDTDPLDLRLLTPEECWELLEKRAFGKESCPDELLDVGKEIAENCKGLPLVADLIAGVIAEGEKKKTVWLEVRNNLNSFILNSEVEVMKVIELSYDHLPHHLKPHLLYLASFSKDTSVRVDVLKLLLHSEGLVEEVTEVYLDNLISSSLIVIFNDIGFYPTFQLHDLVRDFCLIKAREEKLFNLVISSAPSSSSDLLPWKMSIIYDKEHFGLDNFVLLDSKRKRHLGKHLYSLTIAGDKLDNSLSHTCHLRHLRLLRVLKLDQSFIMVKDSLLKEIGMLNHLRYLRMATEVKSLPSSFSNLWNLETLWVNTEGSTLVLLPRIWDLVKLRVLAVDTCSFFDMDTHEPILMAEDSKLENLRYLEKLVLSYSKDTEDIFKRFPNLQHLVFDLKESWDYSTERYWFPKLDILTELELLQVKFDCGPSVATNWSWDFHFPSNLKNLLLYDFPLTSDSLSTIARLPNLEELNIKRTIIQGEEWNMEEEDAFENLKFLGLCEVTLANWEVGEESFPVLEKLLLWECRKLEEIPSRFGEIGSLKIIKLVESPQLEDSALEIKQYVKDITGEDELEIHGRNDFPLVKTDPENLEGREGEVTLVQ